MRIKHILFCYIIFAALSGIGLAVWRTVLMVRYFDPYNNEFALQAEPHLRALGFTLAAVLAILATSAIFLARFEFGKFSASDNQFSVFTSALLGFIFLAIGVFALLSSAEGETVRGYPLYTCTQLITKLFVFLCAAYFILNAADNTRFENARKMLSFATPVWGVAFMVSTYLDPAYNFKDDNHSLCILAVCALVFFLLYESGMTLLGKGGIPYFVFSLLSLAASAVYIIPNFVLLAYWELSAGTNQIYEAALLGTIFYTSACLSCLCRTVKPREKKAAKKNA